MSAQQTQTGGTPPPNVEDTVKDFWATRPQRPREGRKIAGVAAGIGNRYGVDPVIVRVAFVVAAIYGGAGIFLYLVGWLLLPEEKDEVSPFESMVNKGRSSTSTFFTVVLCLALIPLSSWVFDGPFSGLLGVAVVLGLLFLLHRSKGHLNRPAGAADAPMTTPMSTETPTATATATETAEAEAEPAPPAWDPLGAAPFAWDLPDPSPGPEQPDDEPRVHRARRSRVGLMTVGITLVVGALCVAISPNVPWLTPPHIAGLLLAVLGLGMVGGAFAGGGRGLLGLAVPLAALGVLYTGVSTGDGGYHGVGDRKEKPKVIAQVESRYARSIGDLELDLTKLPSTGRPIDTSVDVNVGSATVTLPANADVEVHCHSKIGSVSCLGQEQNGTGSDVQVDDLGADGAGGLKIVLNVEVGTGDVEVVRG